MEPRMDEPPSAGGGAVGGMAQVQDSQPKDSKPNLNGALEAGKSYNASVSQPPYIPQFSAATSLILNRIKGGPHSFSSALTDASATVPRPDQDAYDDARTRLVQSMSTTLEMPPVPERPAPRQWLSSPAVAKEMPTTDSLNMGVKRKRDVEQVAVDFTQNTIVMPPPPPGRAAQQPHGYQSSEAANMAHEKTEVSSYKPRHGVDEYRQQKIEKIRQKRLAALPGGVAPAKPEQVGFGPGSASDYARSEYFYNMKKTDLLNLLSFCDQLKPQLLVDIMVSVSKRHPDLPMFNSPDWDADIPEQRIPKTHHKRSQMPGRSRHGPSLLNSKAKQKIKGNIPRAAIKKPLKRSRLAEEVVVAEEPQIEVDEDAPPPTWPKPGEGLYAKLVPETEDNAFLADSNDEEAFSHFMVDKMGRQIVDPV